MKARVALILAVLSVTRLCATQPAAADLPKDYKQEIRAYIAFEHPDHPNLRVYFYRAKRVTVGDKALERLAVRCLWSYDGPHGEILLGFHEETFLVDSGIIVRVLPKERLTWIGGPPGKADVEQDR